jgi:hypothetical protein
MYFRELATAGITLPFTSRYTDKHFRCQNVDISKVYDFETLFYKIKKNMLIIAPNATLDSAFSNYCFCEKVKTGFDTIQQCFALVEKEISHHPNTEMIYAYIPHFDEISHKNGINSSQSVDLFRQIDKLFTDLVEKCKNTDTLFIVTADHGLIDSTPDKILQLSNYPSITECLILPLCGEPRVPYCYVRPAKLNQFFDEVEKHLGHYCERYSLEELLEKSLYGIGTPNPRFFDRIGDQILLMKENYVLHDRVYLEPQSEYIGYHGGLSCDEMVVPLVMI